MTEHQKFHVLSGPPNRAIKIESGGETYYGVSDADGYAICRHEDNLPESGKPDVVIPTAAMSANTVMDVMHEASRRGYRIEFDDGRLKGWRE